MQNLLHRVQGAVQGAAEKLTGTHHGEQQQQQQVGTGQTVGQQPSSSVPSTSTTTTPSSTSSSWNIQHDTMKKQFVCKCPNDADAYLDYAILAQVVEHGKPCVDLKYIFVPVSERSKGVGSALVMNFLNWAKISNYCVHVNPDVGPFLQETVLNTSDFKSSGWSFDSDKQLLML